MSSHRTKDRDDWYEHRFADRPPCALKPIAKSQLYRPGASDPGIPAPGPNAVVLLATFRGLGGGARRRRDWPSPLAGFLAPVAAVLPAVAARGDQPAPDLNPGLFARRRVEGRWLELSLLGARFGCYLAVLFWLLPLGMAFAFLGVQLAVFGLYMGASFAPNRVGGRSSRAMPSWTS
jgi:hypothetical protein